MAGASLAFVASLLYVLPSFIAGFAGFLGLAAVFLMYSTFTDLSWILHDRAIYRNLVIGSVISFVYATVSVSYLTYSEIASPNGVPQTEYYALIAVGYAASIFYAFFLFRGLSLLAKASGIPQFSFSAVAFVFSALIPVVSESPFLTNVRELGLAVGYLLLAIAFYPEPSQVIMETLRAQSPTPAPVPADMTSGLPLGEKYIGGFTSGGLNKGGAGYGIYATDRRLFGVRSRLAAYGAIELGLVFERDQAKGKTIGELEQKHDLVLDRDEIERLEILKPSLVFNGYLLIERKAGKPIKIRFRSLSDYDRVVELMRAFDPEVLSIRGEKSDKS